MAIGALDHIREITWDQLKYWKADADISFGESIGQICFILVVLAVTYFRREISFTPDYADDDDAFDTKLLVTDAATGAQVLRPEVLCPPSG